MARSSSVKKSSPTAIPSRPEEQGYPVVEVYEAMVDGLKIGTVSLTVDRLTWIAGMDESQSNAHIGSYPSFDEAKSAVTERFPARLGAIQWVRRKIG
jgi:hypothetical protein